MSISIKKYALGATIQDLGRYGYQHLGINPGGAMDIIAMQVANALVTNKLNEAVIEFIYPTPIFHFTQSAFIALSGADFDAAVDEHKIPINQAVYIPAGSTLQFNKKIKGNFCYLAVQGGFDLDDWLGSYSTNLKAGAGGLNGKYLQKNDLLVFSNKHQQEQNNVVSILPWRADTSSFYSDTIDFTEGPEYHFLASESQKKNLSTAFCIQPNSDRMGFRLQGELLENKQQTELISSAVTKGTMQLLPNGELIILMADHQTTGGYPRIGTISNASIASLAQHAFLSSIKFSSISIEESITKQIKQEKDLQVLQQACILRAKEHF
jgi:antagonist of KipI